MSAITTKYHGPTNARGSRVSASCLFARVVLSWDDALNVQDNHRAAVAALMTRMKWPGEYVGAEMKGGGYAFVRAASPVRI